VRFKRRRDKLSRHPDEPLANWTGIMKPDPGRSTEKSFKLLDLFTVQKQEVHQFRIQL
jgi:hypothetical protein